MSTDNQTRKAIQHYCTSISRNRLLVQAAGGNISWKSSDTLWIKASGTWLADAELKEIFVPVDRKPIEVALALGDYSFSPWAREGYMLRPSIETLLHALMPQRIVVHLHPVELVAHLIRPNCRAELQTALGNDFAWDMVDYHKPGADLASAVHAILRTNPDIQVLLLKNHGVILGAETIEGIDSHLQALCHRLGSRPRSLDNAANNAIKLVGAGGTAYQFCAEAELQCLATDPGLFDRLGDSWAICPDHVVFLGARAVRIDDLSALPSRLKAADPEPPFVFVKGVGVLESHSVTLAQKEQLTFFMEVMRRQLHGERVELLSVEEITSLLSWEAEKYRVTLNN